MRAIRTAVTAFAATMTAAFCSAQTGVLDPEAEYRKLPQSVWAAMMNPGQAPKRERPVPPALTEAARNNPRNDIRPVDSDDVNINPVIDSLNKTRTQRPIPGSTRKGNNPVLFLIGDSTMRTEVEGNGINGQWGWGYFLPNFFDSSRISVENHAYGGESTATYLKGKLYPVLQAIRPGDWVILQLGHNDFAPAGEIVNGRYTSTFPDTGKPYRDALNQSNGTMERTFTFDQNIRIYIDEIRLRGGIPLLVTLTPRNRWDEDGKTFPDSKNDIIKAVAAEKGAYLLDLNAALTYKYENVFDRKKVDYLYFSDWLHSSSFGAEVNAETFAEQLRLRKDLSLGSYLLPETKRESAVREGDKPVLFVVGDSTARIGGDGTMVGWGEVLSEFVRTDRITVDNQAIAGRSTRTYLDEGRWNVVYESLRPGDWVIIQFGHNDRGDINKGKARGVLEGNGDEKQVMTMESSGINQGIYSFGWYLRKFCMDVKEKGATPIVLSHTPTNAKGSDGRIFRPTDTYTAWTREAAQQAGAYFVDANEIIARTLDGMSDEQLAAHFRPDGTHTTMEGARRHAQLIVRGIKQAGIPLSKMLK